MLARDIQKTVYKISDFVNWQKSQLLLLSPHFQRRAVWSSGAKSFLIDTIIRGLPVPIIFLREQRTDLKSLEHRREVVDGQQRLRTVFSFVCPTVLKDFDPQRDRFQVRKAHYKQMAEKDFGQLPGDVRQKILDYEFSVHVLPSSVGDREVLRIFSRLNSTGYKLNPQELRNAAYFGEFKTTMFDLAAEQLDRWRSWQVLTEDNIARMEEVEITSEFAQLMLHGVLGKSQVALDRLYKANDLNFKHQPEVARRFRTIMDLIDQGLGQQIHQSAFRKRAPFYALFAVYYDVCFTIGSRMDRASPSQPPRGFAAKLLKAGMRIDSGSAPKLVLESLARRTTHPESRKRVISYLRKSTGIA